MLPHTLLHIILTTGVLDHTLLHIILTTGVLDHTLLHIIPTTGVLAHTLTHYPDYWPTSLFLLLHAANRILKVIFYTKTNVSFSH
jgi:hypothetical protein